MRQYTAGPNDCGMRLDRFLCKLLPHLPPSLIQRSLRQKKARLNGRHQPASARMGEGDVVTLYLNDEMLDAPASGDEYLYVGNPSVKVVYEDENLLIADKPPGQSAQEDAYGAGGALITHIRAYLYQKGEWRPERENSFRPELCHRIDRNTGGLIMAAKTRRALTVICEKLKNREIGKYYLCVVHGAPNPASGTLRDYIIKSPERSMVRVSDTPAPGGREAVTVYRTLSRIPRGGERLTLLECKIETGRTHQIRAQLAAHGHPLLGDGKYGKLKKDEPRAQRLCAYKLSFDFKPPPGVLDYLKGKTVELDTAGFGLFAKDIR